MYVHLHVCCWMCGRCVAWRVCGDQSLASVGAGSLVRQLGSFFAQPGMAINAMLVESRTSHVHVLHVQGRRHSIACVLGLWHMWHMTHLAYYGWMDAPPDVVPTLLLANDRLHSSLRNPALTHMPAASEGQDNHRGVRWGHAR